MGVTCRVRAGAGERFGAFGGAVGCRDVEPGSPKAPALRPLPVPNSRTRAPGRSRRRSIRRARADAAGEGGWSVAKRASWHPRRSLSSSAATTWRLKSAKRS